MSLTDDVRAALSAEQLPVYHLIPHPSAPQNPDLLLIVEGVSSYKVREILEDCPAIDRVEVTSSGFLSIWGRAD